ncbi:hypothetical protein INR49_031694 [Caranx melampygus]|nr:hypothetical protein INR49_031694 [Caranx melampygus]
MAAVDGVLGVIVDSLVSVRRTRFARQHFHWLFLLVSVVGSVLKDLDLVPQTYFSSSRNVLNVYLVKLSWGWTLALLTPFLFLPHLLSGRSVPSLTRHLLSLVVATSVWYVCTETFFYIEDVTGFCHETGAADVIKREFLSKATCRRAGFHWTGWDISGHCFILSYSALVIMEETAHTSYLDAAGLSHLSRRVLRLLYGLERDRGDVGVDVFLHLCLLPRYD